MTSQHDTTREPTEQDAGISAETLGCGRPNGILASGRRLACAVFWMAVIATVIGAVAHFTWTGVIPAWLDAQGDGRNSWLAAGAFAGQLIWVGLPNALDDLVEALEEFGEARYLARHPLDEPPAGLAIGGSREAEIDLSAQGQR